MIVAISDPSDGHARAVLATLRARRVRAVLLDVAELPRRGRISLGYGGVRDAVVATRAGRIRAADVTAVWWRRPRALVADPRAGAAAARFAVHQTAEALQGLASTLRARWVNDPWREAVASRKPHQLAEAQRLGLAVPPTLVTNDAGRARRFLRAHGPGRAVQKALTATPEDWYPTRLVGADDARRLRSLRHGPVILQAYVPGVDVRVTVVGRSMFAAEIDARATRSPEDFRPVFDDARVAPCALPPPVARRLRALVSALGLRYAAVDLRRRDDGEHVFLEANPSGQWLFVERRTGLPITAAVARLLAGR